MTDSATAQTISSALKILLAVAGLLFSAGGLLLTYVVYRLLFTQQIAYEISGHDRLFWALCGVVAFCLIMLGFNFLSAFWRSRTRNIVPGPTLYLLGVTLVIIAMFMAVGGAWFTSFALGVSGLACMRLEYRSDFI